MPKTSGGQIIRVGKGGERLERWINSNLPQIKLALPRGASAERLARVFATEVQRVPRLIECTPMSLIAGFLQISQCGLEIGSHLGQAWLVPFRVKGQMIATPILGYRGLVTLAYRSGIVIDISADAVRTCDEFSYRKGTDPVVEHIKGTGKGTADAEITHAYAIGWIRNAHRPKVDVLTWDEIEKVKRSSRGAARDDSPWHVWTAEMASKTALRRICKTLPLTPETQTLHSAIQVDEAIDANLEPAYDLPPLDLGELESGDDPADRGELTEEQEREAFGNV